MYKFRDALYYIAMLNYHFLNRNCIELDEYNILIEPSDSTYMINRNYGFESVNYKVSIYDKDNNLVYRFVFCKTSASLEYINGISMDEMNDYIYSCLYSLNGRMYITDNYSKLKQLQKAFPDTAKEAGLSINDPDRKVQKAIYTCLKDTLEYLQINLKEMKKRIKT